MLYFAAPMILGNILQQCYNLADTWIVGRYVGSGALAASFVLILGITVVITAGAFLFLHPILNVMEIPADVYDMMFAYVKIILYGLVFIFLYNYFSFLLRSTGNSVIPLVFLSISTVLNIALDYIFVAALDCGVEGAAEATVIAQIISGVGIGIYSLIKEPVLRKNGAGTVRTGGRIRIHASVFGEILSCSAATGIQQSVMNFGILMVQGLVNSFGTAVMAAFAAGVKIDTLAYMPAQEFGNAYSIFISQNYGADEKDRITKGTKSAVAIVLVFCIFISAAVFLLAPRLMGIFISPEETEIIGIGAGYLQIEGACYCGIGILFLLYGYFRAVERPRISLLLTAISLGTRVVLAYAFAPLFGVDGIWWAIPVGWALADVTGAVLVRKG